MDPQPVKWSPAITITRHAHAGAALRVGGEAQVGLSRPFEQTSIDQDTGSLNTYREMTPTRKAPNMAANIAAAAGQRFVRHAAPGQRAASGRSPAIGASSTVAAPSAFARRKLQLGPS